MAFDSADQPYAGRFVGSEHRYVIRIFYEDTDAGGVVYHANYLRYFERARTDMLDLLGCDLIAALASGEGGYVVAAVELAYRRPARLGDALTIVSGCTEVRNSAAVIQQRVMRDDEEVATGKVTVAFVGPDGRPKRQPAAWIDAFRTVMGDDTAQ